MREAETVLGVIQARGERRLPLEDVYRQLFNPNLYLRAYNRIYRNEGAMTKGVTAETVDGMSMAKIGKIIEEIRYERFRWMPVRRVEIPKKNGKTRPLGIPTWTDKLVQEVVRSVLEAYYEPQFSPSSHGFRPDRGCHTALMTIYRTWKGTKWFIEGDIKGCFDNIDHEILMSILAENIHDNRFLQMMKNLLDAGYCEQWKYAPTLSGTPQGGIISPLLANIYLDRLDKFVEKTLLPEFNRGEERRKNREYTYVKGRAYELRKLGRHEEAKAFQKRMRELPWGDPNDPDYRRLKYMRYADDFLLGFAGPKVEAEEIRDRLRDFLHDHLKLELSQEKTLITHAATQSARFLGYEISAGHDDSKISAGKTRAINGVIQLRMPLEAMRERCALYMKDGEPIHRAERTTESVFAIISRYQAELRGYYQYYRLASNVSSMATLRWIMEVSLMKTLANKLKVSVNAIAKKYKTSTETPDGPRTCLKLVIEREGKKPLVTMYGGFALKRDLKAVIKDEPIVNFVPRSDLLERMMAEKCEVCGSTEKVEVHHIRKLADLHKPGKKGKPGWMRVMAAHRRKTLVLCIKCHVDLHAGRLNNLSVKDMGCWRAV